MKAVAGIVEMHARTMLRATPQRTADTQRTEPTPKLAPVMVYGVDTDMPSDEARNSVIAPPV